LSRPESVVRSVTAEHEPICKVPITPPRSEQKDLLDD
jgi:hypothetical protein